MAGLKAFPSFSGQKDKQFFHLQGSWQDQAKLTTEQVAKIFSVFDEESWWHVGAIVRERNEEFSS